MAHIPFCSLGSYYPKTVELSSAKSNAYNSKAGPRLIVKRALLSLNWAAHKGNEVQHPVAGTLSYHSRQNVDYHFDPTKILACHGHFAALNTSQFY